VDIDRVIPSRLLLIVPAFLLVLGGILVLSMPVFASYVARQYSEMGTYAEYIVKVYIYDQSGSLYANCEDGRMRWEITQKKWENGVEMVLIKMELNIVIKDIYGKVINQIVESYETWDVVSPELSDMVARKLWENLSGTEYVQYYKFASVGTIGLPIGNVRVAKYVGGYATSSKGMICLDINTGMFVASYSSMVVLEGDYRGYSANMTVELVKTNVGIALENPVRDIMGSMMFCCGIVLIPFSRVK
jgi:hypothetical protein